MMIDSHAHVYSEYYEDIDTVLRDCKKHNVDYIINSGVDYETNKELLELSKSHEQMYITLGIHPENADDYTEKDLLFIENNINNLKVLAVGEIGLDYHYDGYSKEKQKELFERQLLIAQKYNMPVVIHSRDATFDTLSILKKYKLKGVIHSFSGSEEVAKEFIKLGFVLGINGVVTFKNAKIKDVIKNVGISHFIIETDSPYLTPEPHRGQTNYPYNVKYIVDYLSDFLKIESEYIISITNTNVSMIFDKIKI